ncbi:MAG: trypsin-like peptidase domain-containing protein [Anaerolineales bacterium]|jgi:2-alkenal reductase|nr:trypsin-like peptidase domain-containing protein [Anaerolineales bacterium]
MKQAKNNSLRLMLFILLALSLTALACNALTRETSVTILPEATVEVIVPVEPVEPLPVLATNEEAQLISLYERVNPAVVNITTYAAQDGQMLPVSQGSGFVYDGSGHIVTNAHVIHGSEQIDITFAGGIMRSATIVGQDMHSDLAVLLVGDMPPGISPLPLGSMDALRVGQSVVAIGNPFGYEGTLTRGIISALGRTIPALTIFTIPQSIQTDAAINPGNSGGPLLNLQGEVIGVNAQIETDGETRANSGVGFAIPVSILERVVPSLIEQGKYTWAWLGVRGSSVDLSLVQAMDLPIETGAYIWQVLDNGPADKAGLRGFDQTVTVNGRSEDIGGDVIIAIDGQPVNSFDDLLVYIALKTSPDQTVVLTVLRDGAEREISLTLEPRPEN